MDAMEYADAFQRGVRMAKDELRQARLALDARTENLEQDGEEVPTYLYAAYRGYEAAECWHHNRCVPELFILNEMEPS
jgi:hypothetical protein